MRTRVAVTAALAVLLIGVLALVAVVRANAAQLPLPPAAQYAFNVTTRYWGDAGDCGSFTAQIDTDLPPGSAAFTLQPPSGAPCFVSLSPKLGKPIEFTKTCALFFDLLGNYHGRQWNGTINGVPRLCLNRTIFLMNHPRFLRRFR